MLTTRMSLRLVDGQLDYLATHGWVVHAAAGPAPEAAAIRDRAFTFHHVPLVRPFKPFADLRAFISIIRLCRRLKPTVVHASTPKAGLLGTLAARLTRVPVRVYLARGVRFETASGLRRHLLSVAERVSCLCASDVVCVSRSVRDVLVDSGVAPERKTRVLSNGSSNGVALEWFCDPTEKERLRAQARGELGIPSGAPTVGFVGRVSQDKGVTDLCEAWRLLRSRIADVHLLVAGPVESSSDNIRELLATMAADDRVHVVGTRWDPRPFYAAMDVLCLPSRREGFPNVVLEAAAMGVPSVVTAATGCVDAVVDDVTGTVVPLRAPEQLCDAVLHYLSAPERATAHGRAARDRAAADFDQQRVWGALNRFLGSAVARGRSPRSTAYRRVWKRVFDVLAATILLVVLAPVMLAIAVLVWIGLGRPVLFEQLRPGRNAVPFRLLKFRTMRDSTGEGGRMLPDGERLTRFGCFLRASSLDELPELLNVLRGDMSLVGPRPLLMRYLSRYTAEQARRHEVRPGMTGWAQVNGRNHLTWEQKFSHDLWYVDHVSLPLDLRILSATARQVLARKGINQPGEATAAEFRPQPEAAGALHDGPKTSFATEHSWP